jgi:DNA-binding MarR family transcriptional regulator
MSPDLRDELKQERPFRSIHEEAHLNLIRTTNRITDALELVLKQHGITSTQYNVLRILRGAEPKGLCRNEVSERLLNRMPDATRLLDRMEEADLVSRARDTEDRRLVTTHLTKKGRSLVDSLDEVVDRQHERHLGHLSNKQLKALIDLLTEARNK